MKIYFIKISKYVSKDNIKNLNNKNLYHFECNLETNILLNNQHDIQKHALIIKLLKLYEEFSSGAW